MSHADFSLLLYFLYCPYNFQGTERDWKVIRRLSIDWGFAHQSAIAIRQLLRMRYAQLPIIHRHLVARHLPYEVIRQIEIRQINQQRLYEVIDEDSSEDENSDDETFVGDKQD